MGIRTPVSSGTGGHRIEDGEMHHSRQRPWLQPNMSIKIILPYLLLAAVLGLVIVYVAARMEGNALNQAFNRQLNDSGQRVTDTSVRQEQKHLAAVRAIGHLVGLPEALAAGNNNRLKELVLPYAATNNLDRVVILDRSGQSRLAIQHDPDIPNGYTFEMGSEYSGWPFVRNVLQGIEDQEGDKYIGLAEDNGTWALYTAGPIFDDRARQVGAVLVGTSLDRMLHTWREITLADVTVYDPDGRVLGTTLGQPAPSAVQAVYVGELDSPDARPQRELRLDSRRYGEVLQPFIVRNGVTIGILGVSLPTTGAQAQGTTLASNIIGIFILASIAVIVMGILLARRFLSPINALVQAAERVATGDLSTEVPITTRDELGHLTRAFNSMVVGLRERERVRDIFGRFVSPTIANLVLQKPLNLRGEQRTVTVLFTDLRDFTSMTEQNGPIEVVDTLNAYFEIVVKAVEAENGLVNKFGGDSAMALFGVSDNEPSGRCSAREAINAALTIRRRIDALNTSRARAGLDPIEVGMGINTGPVIAGLIGAKQRMEYTVIGDAVNLSSRIQALSREVGGDIVITEATYSALDDRRLRVVDTGMHQVKGKQQDVHLFTVIDWEITHEPTYS